MKFCYLQPAAGFLLATLIAVPTVGQTNSSDRGSQDQGQDQSQRAESSSSDRQRDSQY
jgi:hypothetical protein